MKKVRIEVKVALLMAVALAFVAVIAVHTYDRFSTIVSDVRQEAKPDMKLFVVKSLLADIIESENHVKSYTLTQDSSYYESFQKSKDKLSNRIDNILVNHAISDKELPFFESLELLIEEKLLISDEVMSLQSEFNAQEALEQAKTAISRERTSTSSTETVSTKARDTLSQQTEPEKTKKKMAEWKISQKIKGLFRRKKRNAKDSTIIESSTDTIQTTDLSAPSAPSESVAISTVENRLNQIMHEEQLATEKLIKQEMTLLEEDRKIMLKISELIAEIELKEREKISLKAQVAEEKAEEVNRQIAVFCIIIGLIMIALIFLILNYVQNNRKYRVQVTRAKKRTEELSKIKERFFANMSHEIRTPLNAIAGFSEQLAQTPLSKEQHEQVEILQKSSEHLTHLVNDILDLSRIQNNKLPFEKIPFLINEVVQDTLKFVSPKAEDNHTELITEIENNVPPVLMGDPQRLRQILLNLIGNAVKFTKNGQVNVSISLLSKKRELALLAIRIKDTGIGMTAHQLQKIFDEFEQADESTSREFGGTGLGLTITKRLVQLHNGKIHLTSEPDKGTTVNLEIPFEISSSKELTDNPTDHDDKIDELKGKKILIVDDESFNRQLLSTILDKNGLIWHEAKDGIEAVNCVEKYDFDLILMDARMPNMNGVEATVEIRKMKDSEKACVPIIALSAATNEQDRQEFSDVGMNGFLPKPFKEIDLLKTIHKSLLGDDSEHLENEDLAEPTETSDTELDFTELMQLSNGDRHFFLDMLTTFISGSEEGMAKIEEGFSKNDANKVADYAHKISAPAAHLNARAFYSRLKQIEKIGRQGELPEKLKSLIADCRKEMESTIQQVKVEMEKHGE